MTQTLSFSGKDLLNGQLLDSGRPIYDIHTTAGLLGRKVTTLRMSDGSLSASLRWRQRSLDVGGQLLSINVAVKPQKKCRIWEWNNNTSYEVELNTTGDWTAKITPAGELIARFNPNNKGKNRSPYLILTRALLPATAAFLILALLYSEKRWKPFLRYTAEESRGETDADPQVFYTVINDHNPVRGVYGGYIGGADSVGGGYGQWGA
ncbi:hypothetical protein HDZ31DRAFT_83228 [Schizophyllum fasciatum]